MAAQTWTSLQTACLAFTVKAQPPYTTVPLDFATVFPQATSYAEGRIFRDIPMLANRQDNSTLTTVAGSRQLNLANMTNTSGGPIIVPEGLSLIVPSGTSNPAVGTRVPYDMASLDVIDLIWPNEATTVTPSLTDFSPRFWALRSGLAMVIAPTPDAAYTAVVTGLYQPTPISATNTTTYVSTYYPDLLEAACMVFLVGALLHNFGAQSDDPRSGLSWEQLYQNLLGPARDEEARRRGLTPDVPKPARAA